MEWEMWTDENGTWKQRDNELIHVEPSQKWIDEHPSVEPEKSEIEKLRIEQAQANAEIVELVFNMMGGEV